jgi:Na+/H+ antiporter NhaD/arsenite permease-like protein
VQRFTASFGVLSISRVIVVITLGFAGIAVIWDALAPVAKNERSEERTGASKGRALAATRRRVRRLPFEIIPFFFGFCVLIQSIEQANLIRVARSQIVALFEAGAFVGAVGSGLMSVVVVNVTNNIPAVILFEKLWLGASTGAGSAAEMGLGDALSTLDPRYADIFIDVALYASNFGANLTFMGALAGLMWLRLLRRDASGSGAELRIPTVLEFVRYGVIVVPVVTVLTCASIALGHALAP